MPDKDRLKIGILGLGQRGLQHLAALWKIPRARVVALCDPFPENLAGEKLRRHVPGFEMGQIRAHATRLRRTFWIDGYQDIAWDRGHLKIEAAGPVAYYYEGPYPPPSWPDSASLRHPLEAGPRGDSTLATSEAFVRAALSGDRAPLLNTFSSSMNSLEAVLAANASDRMGGEQIDLRKFRTHAKYAAFRKKPG